jgi:hypothetical protein
MSGRVLAQVFGFDKEDMAEAFSQTANFLRSVSEFEGIDRLQPDAECPCGSALGVSRCHLS